VSIEIRFVVPMVGAVVAVLAVLASAPSSGVSKACSNTQLAEKGYAHCADIDQGTSGAITAMHDLN
jgi:hypothetical protein